MCDMEGILLLGVFIIFVMVLVMLSTLSTLSVKLERLEESLTRQLKALQNELKKVNVPQDGAVPAPASLQPLVAPKPIPVSAEPPCVAGRVVVTEAPVPLPTPPPLSPYIQNIKAGAQLEANVKLEGVANALPLQQPWIIPPVTPKAPTTVKSPQPVIPHQETAMERILKKIWDWIVVGEEFRNPNVPAEFAIAAAWLVRIGIIIVVMAVGFGLQLSISSGLLGPSGRVACAMLCGSAFVALGLRNMTKKLALLGQGFIGGGLAMFYFAFFAASMMYKLLAIEMAFGCMIGVTATAVLIAVRFNAMSVAVLGVVGGFLTPVMIRTSTGNVPALSAYLLLLGLGILAVAIWRQWPLLTWLSIFLNTAIFSAAMVKYGTGGTLETVYVMIYFALYSTAFFIYPVFRKIKVTPVEIIPLFLNVLITLGWGWRIMHVGEHPRIFLAYLSLGMAAFYVAHIWVLLFKRNFDRGILSTFIALTVILIGVALPLLFTGNILSTVLALQALAFLWLGGKLESRMFIWGAICLYMVVLVRLVIGFVDPHSFAVVTGATYFQGLKDRVSEFLLPMLSIFLAGRCFNRLPVALQHKIGDAGLREADAFRTERWVTLAAFYAAFIVYLSLETFTSSKLYALDFVHANITLVWCVFLFHLLLMRKYLSASVAVGLAWVGCILIVGQWLLCGWTGLEFVHLERLCHHDPFTGATALPRLMSTVLCAAALLAVWQVFKGDDAEEAEAITPVALYTVLALGFFYLTFEAATFCDVYVLGFRRWAVSIVWGCYGLSLLLGGLHFAKKELRMTGLLLFAITIFKIFLVDLEGSSALFRLIAFGLVGIVFLLAAYAYLKKQDTFKRPEQKKG
jgi:uncharacterized membrane protein